VADRVNPTAEERLLVREWVESVGSDLSPEAIESCSGTTEDRCQVFAAELVRLADEGGLLPDGLSCEQAEEIVLAVNLATLRLFAQNAPMN
jgi:hypothetical protein